MDKAKGTLRFGILVEGSILKRWQQESIYRLLEAGHRLELVIQCSYQNKEEHLPSRRKKYLSKNALYHFHQRFFHRAPLLKNVDCAAFFASYPKLDAKVERKGKYSDYLRDESILEIKDHKLDFILRFGLNILRGDILQAAQFGIWSLHHDDERIIRGGPPGFWEIAKQHDINGILLQQLTEKLDQGIPLRKSYLPVIRHSWTAHHNELLRTGIDMIVYAASELANTGEVHPQEESEGKGGMYYFPTNVQMLAFLFRLGLNKFIFHFNDLFRHENWNFGIAKISAEELFETKKIGAINWHPQAPKKRFYADAFFAQEEGQLRVLFENFDYQSFKATIDECLYTGSAFQDHKTRIQEEVHLSFPFVLKQGKEKWIIPESQQAQNLYAYHKEGSKLLMEQGAIDAVIFSYEDRWWLFCTFKSAGSNLHLFAFHNTELNSEWIPHARNPIVSDARKARMAGDVASIDDRLYRPAQINHKQYGGGIRWMRIELLTPTEYKENEAFCMDAKNFKKYNKGMHTISFQDGYTLIDAKNNKFVFREFVRKLKQKL